MDSVVVFGSSWNGTNYDLRLVKYDYNGTFLWQKSYNGGSYYYGYGVGCDSHNNIIVTSWKGSWPNSFDIHTIKYDPNGNILWQITYNSGRNDRPYELVVDHSDNILIVGSSNNGTNEDVILLKYDTNGNLLPDWPKIYNGSFNRDDQGYSIAIDEGNNIFIAGISSNGVNSDYLILKYTSNGILQWNKIYDSGANDNAYGIACDYLNNIIVAGKANDKFHTIKYTSNGNILWERDFLSGPYDEI